MTVRRGSEWGTFGPAPASLVRATSDADVAAVVAGQPDAAARPVVALLGGDLLRACGGSGDGGRLAGDVALLPIDALRVEAAGQVGWAVAHVVARRSWWRGEVVALVNEQYVGTWDVAPRAHPNDGRVDVVHADASMSVRHRWQARRRLPLGTHVPHPAITTRQAKDVELTFARPLDVWLDGRRWVRAASLRCTVVPDALTVCV